MHVADVLELGNLSLMVTFCRWTAKVDTVKCRNCWRYQNCRPCLSYTYVEADKAVQTDSSEVAEEGHAEALWGSKAEVAAGSSEEDFHFFGATETTYDT